MSLTDPSGIMMHTSVWKVQQLPHSKNVNPSGHSEHWYHSVCHQHRDLENCGNPLTGCPHNPSGTPHIYMSPAEKRSFLLEYIWLLCRLFNSDLLPQRLFRVKWDDNSYICYVKTQNCGQHTSQELMALVKELKLRITHTTNTAPSLPAFRRRWGWVS